jgi:dGTPase
MTKPFLALREEIENNEEKILAIFACKSRYSNGRKYPEKQDERRTCFQRDRDRVIHCNAYRRLKGKTQVFIAHHGDHFRNRLTHSMEVAQLSRDFSRTLRINEDLAETIALSHDLGHTPFGHAGQEAMQNILHQYGLHFEHNLQSKRVVEVLEKKSPKFSGLNLSFEVLDGLIKHRKERNYHMSHVSRNGTLEAQVVDMADHIAYQNHDIDDGIRAGILSLKELEALEIWKEAVSKTDSFLPERKWISEVISSLIKIMSLDFLNETAQRLFHLRPKKSGDIQNAKQNIVAFSPDMKQKDIALKELLHKKFYKQEIVLQQSKQGMKTIEHIFSTLKKYPHYLPEEFSQMLSLGERKEGIIKDFIAGMTDSFALDFSKKLRHLE